MIPTSKKVPLKMEIFQTLAAEGQLNTHRYHDEWIDIGVPARCYKTDKLLRTPPSSIAKHTTINTNTNIINSII